MIMILFAPALLVIALLLIWQGARGVLQFGEPHCRRCGYDLRGLDFKSEQRTCTECGTDVGKPGTVRYADYRRSPRRIAAGIVLIGLCVLGFTAEELYRAYRYRTPSVQSNAKLIANLITGANARSNWEELQKRYMTGRLSGSEVAAAFDQLIGYLKANPSSSVNPYSSSNPLLWAEVFFGLAVQGGHLSDERVKPLCDAYYGTDPGVRMQTRIRQGRKLIIEFRSRNNRTLPGVKWVQALRLVQIDGKPLEAVARDRVGESRDYLSCQPGLLIEAEANMEASPGKHEMMFELDWGLLDEKTQISPRFGDLPGQAERWPRTLVRRVLTAKVPIEVVPPDVSPIKLVTDPARDPSTGGPISITSIQVTARGKSLSLRPRFQVPRVLVPFCFRIRMKAAGKEHDLGWEGSGEGPSRSFYRPIDSLPADVREATVILEPAPDIAEECMTYEEIWGKPIVFERVPLDRYDLEDQATMEGETKPASR